MGILWYMSALVPTPATRPLFTDLNKYLEMDDWSAQVMTHVYTCRKTVAGIRDGYNVATPAHRQSDNTIKDSFRHSETGYGGPLW